MFFFLGACTFELMVRLALIIAILAALSGGVSAQVIILNNGAPGTYGNETASSLYLRPLNNSMLGSTYFGTGYPRGPQTATITTASEPSGIVRANAYLHASGWYTREAERRAAHAEREAMQRRIRDLEKRVAELEGTDTRAGGK